MSPGFIRQLPDVALASNPEFQILYFLFRHAQPLPAKPDEFVGPGDFGGQVINADRFVLQCLQDLLQFGKG